MTTRLKSGFNRRLRAERERLGLSQKDFAERAGVKRVTQFLYEKGDSQPNYRYLMAIDELGVDMPYLFFGTPSGRKQLSLNPGLLRDVYRIVDEVARDKNGELLPLDERLDLFNTLCAAYSGRNDDHIDIQTVTAMLKR